MNDIDQAKEQAIRRDERRKMAGLIRNSADEDGCPPNCHCENYQSPKSCAYAWADFVGAEPGGSQ